MDKISSDQVHQYLTSAGLEFEPDVPKQVAEWANTTNNTDILRAYLAFEEDRASQAREQWAGSDTVDEDNDTSEVVNEVFSSTEMFENYTVGSGNPRARVDMDYHGESFHQGE